MSSNESQTKNQQIDIPLSVPEEMAKEIRDDLRDGNRVNVWFTADQIPWMADCIDWQLENDQQATEYVEDYDEH